MKRRKHPNNRIWTVLGMLAAVFFSLYSIRSAFVSVVALEQSARCGAEEHIHTAACYEGSSVICTRQPHTHNRNCYLVLLKDNDINVLLSQVDAEQNHSLEQLIHQTVDTALQYNTDLIVQTDTPARPGTQTPHPPVSITESLLHHSQAPELDDVILQTSDVVVLNQTITEQAIQPAIVLNEDLYTTGVTGSIPTDTTVLGGDVSALVPGDGGNNGGISTLALGDNANTGNNVMNFYVQIDGTWTLLTTLTRDGRTESGNNKNKSYTPYINTTTLMNAINNQLRQDVGVNPNFTSSTLMPKYSNSSNVTSNSWSGANVTYNNQGRTTFGTYNNNNGSQDAADAPKYVRLYRKSGTNTNNPVAYWSVTLHYPNGTATRSYVAAGGTYQLPASNDWTEGTTEYNGGTSVTVNSARVFYATPPTVRVEYTLNFPTSFSNFGDNNYVRVNKPTTPTIGGTTSTTVTDKVEEGDSTTVRSVSESLVIATTTHNYGEMYPIRFMGWRTETGELISPSTNLTWEALQAYANGDGTAKLTGVWTHGINNMVNFFVLYNAKVGETTNSSDLYTPSIYATHVGGTINTSLSIDARTDEAAVENDRVLRAMYGPSSGSMWLDTFPTDEYVFEQLKQYAQGKLLTVDGITVDPNDLNSSAYAIRWYMLKHHSDGWHIDGKLTRKKGQITVDKEFFGAENVIHEAEQGFHLVAINGTLDTSGNFIPYTPANSLYQQYVLVLREYDKTALRANYPNATFLVYDHTAAYADGEGFEWLIEGVDLGEYWQINEYPMPVDGQMYYAEYSVYDTDGETSAVAEYGTTASVVGKTFALDEDPDQGLLVDFRNYYYPTESILIKKEDADTGQPIGGAAFELWQEHDGVSTQLTFSYDGESQQYRYDNDGDITRISTGDEGFTTITTTGFSYSHGPVTVKEVIAPTGYASAPHITLTEQSKKVSITDMRDGDGNSVPQSEWADYGEVYDDGSVLVVKDRASSLTEVTANKVWADSATADSVTLVLQANGTTATNLFPGLANVRAELNAANNWQYTWTDLPTYANGSPVTWSVKEIMVGPETTLADGTSFANWTVIYSTPVRTDTDGDGVTDHWQCTVTNSVRRAQLYLVKTDPGGKLLPGAAFELVEVGGSGNPVSGAVTYTGVTDANGLLRFDNLKYTTRYRLTETHPPDGYDNIATPAYLTLAADGTVTMEYHSNVTANSGPYRVNVVNIPLLPLPETGGSGPGVFFGLGGALMLLSVCGSMLLYPRKKGRRESG